MNKSNMMIAVFSATMAAASAAKAGNINIDFDGGTPGSISIAEAIHENTAVVGDTVLPPAVPAAEPAAAISPWWAVFFNQHGGIQPICQPMPYSDTSWYEMVRCGGIPANWDAMLTGAQDRTRFAASARILQPGLQRKLRDILLGYCDTYPEFAATVLPMLKDENVKITSHGGVVYIISGEKMMRFGGHGSPGSLNNAAARKGSLSTWGAAAEAVQAVCDAVAAWNEYSSWPPVPDSGTADDYHGPALTVDQDDLDDLQSYPSKRAGK